MYIIIPSVQQSTQCVKYNTTITNNVPVYHMITFYKQDSRSVQYNCNEMPPAQNTRDTTIGNVINKYTIDVDIAIPSQY